MNSQTIEIVKSTAPVLKEHSEVIGKRFYELLFGNHPELYNLFNQTNQRRGIQQEALAHSVYTSGENLDHLEPIRPIITRIAHKHRAIGIVPEQYPIVGEHLLQAVKEVLGDQVNDEILGAWEEAYEYLADLFIGIEKELYEQARNQPGGWEGFREFVVDRKVKESDVITSFYLKPADGKAIASYQPGQYLTLRARIPGEEYDHIRHYSLSDKPGEGYYRISVKREDAHDDIPAGIVSNYLHNQIAEGDRLSFSAPAGDFTVDMQDREPLILLAGGVGLTPLISMFNTVAKQQPERSMTFIQASINSNVHAMREHVAEIAEQNPNIVSYIVYERPTEQDRQEKRFDKEGFINRPWLESILTQTDGVYYVCGPIPFMNAVIRALKEMGIPQERIHFEAFSPISVLDAQKEEVHS